MAREKSRDSLKTLMRKKEDEYKKLKSDRDVLDKEYTKLKKNYASLDDKYRKTYSKLQELINKSNGHTSTSVQPYLNYAQLNLKVGEQVQLVLKNANSTQVQGWYSENEKVACAVSPGIVRGIKRGNTKVWVTYKGTRYYCSVTVR